MCMHSVFFEVFLCLAFSINQLHQADAYQPSWLIMMMTSVTNAASAPRSKVPLNRVLCNPNKACVERLSPSVTSVFYILFELNPIVQKMLLFWTFAMDRFQHHFQIIRCIEQSLSIHSRHRLYLLLNSFRRRWGTARSGPVCPPPRGYSALASQEEYLRS